MRTLPIVLVAWATLGATSPSGQVVDAVSPPVPQQYDLSTDGHAFLLKEAENASFFMLGELHGENEIPALIRNIWPSMWKAGYRHVAAEVSPWAADRLEFAVPGEPPPFGLWTQPDVMFVTSLKRKDRPVLWGCDIDEVQPDRLLRELASLNRSNSQLRAAVEAVGDRYDRRQASAILDLVRSAAAVKDRLINGASLRTNLLRTLEVEADRATRATLQASMRREAVMKDLFYDRWRAADSKPKVLLRFGRNHLHRGYDRRGVSTLGNFVAELAVAERLQVFNIAAFAGGGKIALGGPPSNFDERSDDPAFAYLASIARYPATVFDLRPLRAGLHRLPSEKRSPVEASLLYWADTYDAILFYREVTPLGN
jgi:hypothetical protein